MAASSVATEEHVSMFSEEEAEELSLEDAEDRVQEAEDKLARMLRRAELMEKEARAIKQASEEQAAALLLDAEQELINAEIAAQRKKDDANKKILAAEMLEEVRYTRASVRTCGADGWGARRMCKRNACAAVS